MHAPQQMDGVTSTTISAPAPVPYQQWGTNQYTQQAQQQQPFVQQFQQPIQQQQQQRTINDDLCACGNPFKLLSVKKQNENEGRWFRCCPQDKAYQCKKSFRWMDHLPRKPIQLAPAPSVNLTTQYIQPQQYRKINVGPNGQFVTPMKTPVTTSSDHSGMQTRALVTKILEEWRDSLVFSLQQMLVDNSEKHELIIKEITHNLTENMGKLTESLKGMAGIQVSLQQQVNQVNVQLNTIKVQLNELGNSLRIINNSSNVVVTPKVKPKTTRKRKSANQRVPDLESNTQNKIFA